MSMPSPYPYYTIWRGSLSLGDTPGFFQGSAFVGLILQLPIAITFLPTEKEYIEIMLQTTEVEITNKNAHPVYLDWIPGSAFPNPIGHIDDVDYIPNRPEYHLLKIKTDNLTVGTHTLAIIVNNIIPLGLRDDFILVSIDADNDVGMKIGTT